MSHDHEGIRRFSEHGEFFSCSCGNSGFKHGSVIVNNIFAYFALLFEFTPGTHALVFFGLLTGSPDRLSRRTPKRTPFHPKQTLCGVTFQRARPLPATPFQCPRSRTATLGWGAAAPFLP